MTETPQQHDEQTQRSDTGVATGVDTGHLRNYERLRRSRTDRKIAGVAGGLGRHLNIDPTVLRVLFVVLALFGGAGLLLYGAAWLIVPEEGSEESIVQTSPSTRNALLIVAGVVAALLLIGDSWGGFGFPWPLAILALIVFAVLMNRDRPAPSAGQASGTPPAGPTAYGLSGGTWQQQATAPQAGPASDAPTTAPTEASTVSAPAADWQAPGAPGAPGTPYPPGPPVPSVPPVPPVQPKADRGPKLFGITIALVALSLGALGLYEAAGNTVVDAAYPALALTVIGVMLVVGSFAGRPGGLVFLGVVAALILGATSAVDGNWNSDRRILRVPVAAEDVRNSYSLTAGQIVLDLTEVKDLENLDGRRLALHAEAGEILVTVPEGVDVDVDSSIRFGGEIEVDGVVENGNSVDLDRRIEGGDDVPQIYLELDLLVGHIEVQQEEAA